MADVSRARTASGRASRLRVGQQVEGGGLVVDVLENLAIGVGGDGGSMGDAAARVTRPGLVGEDGRALLECLPAEGSPGSCGKRTKSAGGALRYPQIKAQEATTHRSHCD